MQKCRITKIRILRFGPFEKYQIESQLIWSKSTAAQITTNANNSISARYFRWWITTDFIVKCFRLIYFNHRIKCCTNCKIFRDQNWLCELWWNPGTCSNEFDFSCVFRRIGTQQGPIQESCRRNGLHIRRIGWLLNNKCFLIFRHSAHPLAITLTSTMATQRFLSLKNSFGKFHHVNDLWIQLKIGHRYYIHKHNHSKLRHIFNSKLFFCMAL